MKYIFTKFNNPDFIQLCYELDCFLDQIAGGVENRTQYVPFNQLSDIADVVIAYDGNKPIGCAGIKQYDSEYAEVKRVYIKKEYRGKGISKELMKLLEEKARDQGYRYMILESGEPLVAAMQLYRNIGYKIIPNYGHYENMGESICMKKELYINGPNKP